MYKTYWHLDSMPFEDTTDTAFFVPAETHEAALLKLRYAVENGRSAALLAGAAGLGKTLIVQALKKQLAERFAPHVHLVFPQMPPDQLLAYLAESLSGKHYGERTPTIAQSVRLIEQATTQNVEAGRHAWLVIDEAQDLDDPQILETIRLLLNFQCGGRPPFTLLLVGQPSLLPMMERAPELDERMAVKCLLRPLHREETIEYVNRRLQVAGAQRQIFTPEALDVVYKLSHGVPRQINRLCDLALLIGFAEEQKAIGPEQIEAVAEELVAVASD